MSATAASASDAPIRAVVVEAQQQSVSARWFVKDPGSAVQLYRAIDSLMNLKGDLEVSRTVIAAESASTSRGRTGRQLSLRAMTLIARAASKRIAAFKLLLRGGGVVETTPILRGETQDRVSGFKFFAAAVKILRPL